MSLAAVPEIGHFLETDRLFMRPVEELDLKNCNELYSDPEITALFETGPKTMEEISEYVHKFGIQQFKDYPPFGLYSVFRKDDSAFIGQADLFTIDQDKPGEDVEIGFILKKEYHGQKYGAEIGAALKEYARTLYDRGHPRVKRIVATAHPSNSPSWKILEKLGMDFVEEAMKFNGPRKVYQLEFSTPTLKSTFEKA